MRGFEDRQQELAVPLRWDEEIFGVLNIEDIGNSQDLRRMRRTLIEAVASQISLALKNANLFEQIRKSKVYLELVLNAAEDTSIISLDRVGENHHVQFWIGETPGHSRRRGHRSIDQRSSPKQANPLDLSESERVRPSWNDGKTS